MFVITVLRISLSCVYLGISVGFDSDQGANAVLMFAVEENCLGTIDVVSYYLMIGVQVCKFCSCIMVQHNVLHTLGLSHVHLTSFNIFNKINCNYCHCIYDLYNMN